MPFVNSLQGSILINLMNDWTHSLAIPVHLINRSQLMKLHKHLDVSTMDVPLVPTTSVPNCWSMPPVLLLLCINMMFEQHTVLESLGRGTLIALQKPRKPLGPLSSLRPIVLLNCTRKVISLVALHRIQEKVNTFTGASQGGFKQGYSCADLVWVQCMLIATVQSCQWDFHRMGIDMSHAFDTIKQGKALEVLM